MDFQHWVFCNFLLGPLYVTLKVIADLRLCIHLMFAFDLASFVLR